MTPVRVMRIIARMNVGGPAVEVCELMRGLDQASVEQVLFTGWCADDESDFLLTQAPDVDAIRVNGLGRSIRPGDDARVLARLTREIRRRRPDIIHTHTAKAGVLGRLAARAAGSGSHLVHTFHGHLLHGYFSPAKTRAVVHVERALARLTDDFVVVGEQVRDDLLSARIGRVSQYHVIRSGVQLGQLPDAGQAREALGIEADRQVVLVMGRLTRIKRPDRVVEIAQIIRSRHPDALFLVAGSGDEAKWLASEVAARRLPVRLLGWRSDVEALLAASDLILLTSDNEGTPLSLAQAALAGVPAVASRVGSVPEVVIDGQTGLLRPPVVSALSEALDELLANGAMRAAMGVAAREYVSEAFSVDRFLAAHRDLYLSVRG